jgi:hypothetical protein
MTRSLCACSLLAPLLILSASVSFAQVPQSSHVFIVLEENANYSDVIGNPKLPYLNSLANRYALSTNYFADTHPSIGNYFMLTTGQILTNDDSQTPGSFPVSVDNVVRELLAAGKTWKSYCEDIPSVGYTGGDSGKYSARHCPLAYMADVQNSPTQKQNLVPFTQFPQDLADNKLPNFSFIAPNLCNDAHDCPLLTADAWLQANIDPLINSPAFQQDGVLILVFDESESDNSNGGGRIPWIVVGPRVNHGLQSNNFYQHQNTLRLLSEALGLTKFPGAAATTADMHEFFSDPPPPQPPSCTPSASPSRGPLPLPVTAKAACKDPQNALVSTRVTRGDGSSTHASSSAHSYAKAGSVTNKVTATGSADLAGRASQTVTATTLGISGPVTINGQNGTVIENLHITNPNGDCVTVTGSTNITIRRSEIGPCGGNGVNISGGHTIGIYDSYIHPGKPLATGCCDTHDGIFANGTSNLSIEGNVIAYGESNVEVSSVATATVTGNFLLNPINSDPSQPADGQSRGHNFQTWANSSNVALTNNYMLSSTDTTKYLFAENQEDSINLGLTNGVIASNNYITGGHSPSGCGLILDTGANSAQLLNNTLLDTGQCGIGIADGTNQRVDGNKILNRNPVNGGGNTALYVWKATASDPPCGPVQVSNNIASAIASDGSPNRYWHGGGCDPVTLINNTFDLAAQQALEPSGQKLPPPSIPPGPKDCVVASPFTNNTSFAPCTGDPPPSSAFGLNASPSTTQGGRNRARQSVSITNSGSGTLNGSATARH